MKHRTLVSGMTLELDVSGLSLQGDGLAEGSDGLRMHVPGALPGERVQVRVDHVSRQAPLAHATLLQVLVPSAARRAPPCPHQGRCGGCALMVADEPAQRRLKQESLRTELGLELDRLVHVPGAELGYRWSTKRVAGGRRGALVLGSYVRRTHRVARMTGCLVEQQAVSRAAELVERAASELGFAPAAPGNGSAAPRPSRADERAQLDQPPRLRAAWLKTDGAGHVLVCLVTPDLDGRRLAALAPRLGPGIGLSSSTFQTTGDGLRGDAAQVLSGPAELQVTVAGVATTVGPLGFLQPNPPVAELAYRDLVASPEGEPHAGTLAVDLYAGSGATTRLLRQRFERVMACEAYPESAAQLGLVAERADELLGRLVAERAAGSAPPVDLVVANPPRAGLGIEVCGLLRRLGPRRLQLMSCGPSSLARDLAALGADPSAEPAPAPSDGLARYRLLALRGYDTLPQTPHVELIAWLERG